MKALGRLHGFTDWSECMDAWADLCLQCLKFHGPLLLKKVIYYVDIAFVHWLTSCHKTVYKPASKNTWLLARNILIQSVTP